MRRMLRCTVIGSISADVDIEVSCKSCLIRMASWPRLGKQKGGACTKVSEARGTRKLNHPIMHLIMEVAREPNMA